MPLLHYYLKLSAVVRDAEEIAVPPIIQGNLVTGTVRSYR